MKGKIDVFPLQVWTTGWRALCSFSSLWATMLLIKLLLKFFSLVCASEVSPFCIASTKNVQACSQWFGVCRHFFPDFTDMPSSFTDCFLLNIITQLFLKLIVRSPFLRGYERHCEHWGALCSVCNHSTLCIYQRYVPLVGKSVAIEYNSSKCIVCDSLLLLVIISLYSNLTPSPDQLLDNNSNPLLVWTISSRYAMAMGR